MDEASVNQQLAELGATPISAAQPCGQSARYEPEFEQLEAELAKQESLTPSAVDWGKVVELATVILQTKSKDLLVAAYLCRGLMETQRYAGLAQGLRVLRDLTQQHWDGLFPELKRMRARATAVSWLAEKTGKQVRDTRPKSGEKDAVTQAAALLKELDQVLVEKMGQDAPALTDLSRPLKDHLQNLETPAAAAKPAAAAAARPAAAAPAEIAEVLNDADAKKVLRQMQELARKVTKYWLSKDVVDARAYRLGRTAGWLTVESAPAATDGQTQIPGPAPEKLKQFETQRQAGQLEALLPELESTLAKAPYWLDGQKLAADVLESLGERGAAARKTVLRELANFNAAVPGLTELKFLGGKPFAEDLTRDWIAEHAAGIGGGQPSGGKRAQREAEPWEEAFNNARATATAGNVDGAVKQLTDGFNATASAHEQFMWRLALAQLLVQTGHANVAAPVLESLTARIEEFRLREWEPELAVRVYKLLLTAYDKSTGKAKSAPEVAARAANAFSALSSLDPAIALNVKL